MFKIFTLLLAFFLFFNTLNAQDALVPADDSSKIATLKRVCPPKCILAIRCDAYYTGPPTWAVVDGVCKLYKSRCIFTTHNCQRQNDCLSKMVSTTQYECQQHCIRECKNQANSPVCAIFTYRTLQGDANEGRLTFINKCELDKWACWNSMAYLSTSPGMCT